MTCLKQTIPVGYYMPFAIITSGSITIDSCYRPWWVYKFQQFIKSRMLLLSPNTLFFS